jgi:hypothetical protein
MLERRLQKRVCQLQLATRPDGTVHRPPWRVPSGDPGAVNDISAMSGSPDEIGQGLGAIPRSEQGGG